MTAPLWGHKPAPVADIEGYWGQAPSEPSERAVYWTRRLREGTWRPNRWLRRECGDCQAHMLGVWIWEARRAFIPMESLLNGHPVERIAAETAEWSDTLPGPYWALLEERSRPASGGGDQVATLAAAMQAVRERPVSSLGLAWGRR